MPRVLTIVAAAAAVAPVTFSQAAAEPPRYTVQVIGVPGIDPATASYSLPIAVNNLGLVFGRVSAPELPYTAFLWQNGIATPVNDPPGYTWGFTRGVNDSGLAVGTVIGAASNERAAASTGGVTSLLELPAWATNSSARGVSSTGAIVGWADSRAIYWPHAGAAPVELAMPADSTISIAFAVNDFGMVAGSSRGNSADPRAVVWHSGQPTILPIPAGTGGSFATAINSAGEVAGYTVAAPHQRAVLWREEQVIDLGDFGVTDGLGSQAWGVNAHSQAVGFVERGGLGQYVGFLWDDGVLHDLNDLLEPASGAIVHTAMAISDTGFIVAGAMIDGQPRTVLLTPVPGPGGAALAGVAVLSLRRRRR